MSTFPRIFRVVRDGLVQDVRVESLDDLLRLRTELELVRLCGIGSDERVRDTLDRVLRRESDADLADLCSVLHDAAHPDAVTCIARMDREAPDVQRQINRTVVREASEQFRRDVATWLRRSGRPEAEKLAANYERRVEVLVRMRPLTGTEVQHDRPSTEESAASEQEDNTMTDKPKNPTKAQAEASPETTGGTAGAATDDSVQPTAPPADAQLQEALEAAVREADAAKVTDANQQIEDFLEGALACVKETQVSAPDSPAAAQNGPAPTSTPADTTATEVALAAVEADVTSLVEEIDALATAPAVAANSPPPVAPGADDVDSGIHRLAAVMTGELERLWGAVREARSARNQSDGVGDDARQVLARIEAVHKQAAGLLDEARLFRDEARNHRDEARRLVERITAFANDAAESADQARSEARTAITCAKHARRVGASADSQ
jgi:hypothetical protein